MAIDLAVYTSHVLPGCNECNSGDAYNLSDHVFDVPNNVAAISLIRGVFSWIHSTIRCVYNVLNRSDLHGVSFPPSLVEISVAIGQFKSCDGEAISPPQCHSSVIQPFCWYLLY